MAGAYVETQPHPPNPPYFTHLQKEAGPFHLQPSVFESQLGINQGFLSSTFLGPQVAVLLDPTSDCNL